ncbi:hypothetical protein MTsN2n4_28730 [Pseudoalteromonas sp. MTN2-4]
MLNIKCIQEIFLGVIKKEQKNFKLKEQSECISQGISKIGWSVISSSLFMVAI